MIATLREGTEQRAVSLAALEADLRAGQVDPDAELCHPPWTGPRFCPLRHVSQLSEAWDAPDARLHLWMKSYRPPVLALSVAALITGAAAVQTVLAKLAPHHPLAAAWEAAWVRWGAVGFDATLLSGHWWSPLASQIVHAPDAPLLHLAANLPVLAYCGIRVQRALGAGSYAVVAALGVLCGSGLVIAGANLPVVGSSLLAYGLWAAQIGIGFRFGRTIPPAQRGFYGWGTWFVFAPLTLLNVQFGDVSQLGHLGAVAGGLLAVAVLEPESAVPKARERTQRRRNLGFAGALIALGVALLLLLSRMPGLLVEPGVEMAVAEAGVTLTLPTRMAPFSLQRGGMDLFRPGPDTEEVIYVGLQEEATEQGEVSFWSDRLGTPVEGLGAPEQRGDGWVVQTLQIARSQQALSQIATRVLRRGRWTLRVGTLLAEGDAARAAFYEQVLQSLIVGDPPELAAARRALAVSPESPKQTMGLVDALIRAGGTEEAVALLEKLARRGDGWGRSAERWRAVLVGSGGL